MTAAPPAGFVTSLFVERRLGKPSRFAALRQLWRSGEVRILTRRGDDVLLSTSVSIVGDVIVAVNARAWTRYSQEDFRALVDCHHQGVAREFARMNLPAQLFWRWARRAAWLGSGTSGLVGFGLAGWPGVSGGPGVALALRYLPRRWTLRPVHWALRTYAQRRFRRFLRGT
jgi:hypothetical protein